MWRRTKRVFYTAGVAFAGYYGYRSYVNFNDKVLADWGQQYANATAPSRREHKTRLGTEEFDVLVIGGGATGTGVALDAATRGLKVALVERDDFASGASSKSTKLLHGGIRYLEKAAKNLDYGEYKLVTEALHERTRVLRNAPHLSHPLPIILPIKSWIDLPQFWIGLKMYDSIAGSSGMFSSYYLSKDKTITVFPTINPDMLKCSLVYYDGQMNDARLNVALALTAASHGAAVVNHTEVVSLIRKPNPHFGGSTLSTEPARETSKPAPENSKPAPENFKPAPENSKPAPGLPSPATSSPASLQSPPLPPLVTPSIPSLVIPPVRALYERQTNEVEKNVGDDVVPNADMESGDDVIIKVAEHYRNAVRDQPTNDQTSPNAIVKSLTPVLPSYTPASPPIGAPETPVEKFVESVKTWIFGSDKNKETGTQYPLGPTILAGAVVRDTLTGEVYEIRAKSVINATGAFADTIRNMDTPVVRPLVAASEGTHIMLPGHLCPPHLGFIDAKSPDGRVVFLLPFENHTLVGTTDASCDVSFDPKPPEQDITFILDQVRTYLNPDIKLKRSDVLAAWSGIRPLALDPNSHNTAEISRNHIIHVDNSGLVSIVGGKWTTYRKMSEDTMDKAIETALLNPPHRSHTEKLPLWGAHKYRPTLFITLMQTYGLEHDIATHLARAYGDKAFAIAEIARKGYGRRVVEELPFLEAEIVYSVNEYAETVVDVIARRTRLAFLDNEKAKASIPKVVELLASQLHWDEARKQKETAAAHNFLETMK